MGLSETLDGEALTGKQAVLIFFGWIGLVLIAGVVLAFVV